MTQHKIIGALLLVAQLVSIGITATFIAAGLPPVQVGVYVATIAFNLIVASLLATKVLTPN